MTRVVFNAPLVLLFSHVSVGYFVFVVVDVASFVSCNREMLLLALSRVYYSATLKLAGFCTRHCRVLKFKFATITAFTVQFCVTTGLNASDDRATAR